MLQRFLPSSISPLERARAKVVTSTCLGTITAMLFLVLYWIMTGSLEHAETILITLIFIAILTGMLILVKRGSVRLAAWSLVVFTSLINVANMIFYGIGTTASAGFLIPIALAIFCIGVPAGIGFAVFASFTVFAIAWLGSIGQIQTIIPYQDSNLTFDAPVLTLTYLIFGVLTAVWIDTVSKNIATK